MKDYLYMRKIVFKDGIFHTFQTVKNKVEKGISERKGQKVFTTDSSL